MKKKLLFTLFVLMSFNSSYAQEVFYLHAIKISEKNVPLIIFLHGSGERGDDNELQLTHGAM